MSDEQLFQPRTDSVNVDFQALSDAWALKMPVPSKDDVLSELKRSTGKYS